ncbi:unnamed protein product [Owenia fusiformis]|uniref:Uncharacterized protein n=1 Tax=Owenia fusiformis TaxID=6347 RepID=A0A8J1TWI2_OWEFU|nr:unnamed protein product [Owenia fusiformis]
MDVDDAISRLGRYSKWQLLKYNLLSFGFNLSGSWQMVVIIFAGMEPSHHCKVPDNSTINETIPMETDDDGVSSLSKCSMYFNGTNETTSCSNGWEYSMEYGPTIITEWDLVCERNYYSELSQSVFSGGVMVGAVLFTWLADTFGRKPIHLFCQYVMVVLGVIIAFSPDITTFIVLRFFIGALREGSGLVAIVMCCELFPASQRSIAGTALQLHWSLCWMLLALVAYFVRTWRYLLLITGLSCSFTIFYIWFVDESIPWLVANGKLEKAERIIQSAAKFNKIQYPKYVFTKSDATYKEKNNENGIKKLICYSKNDSKTVDKSSVKSYTILDILKSKTLIFNTLIMCFLWFVNILVYYGLSLQTGYLAGNLYLNFFLSGLVEVPAYLAVTFSLNRYGRRWPVCIFHIMAGLFLIATILIPKKSASGTDLSALVTTFSMIGKFAITASFAAVVLFSPEIYPTNLRNFGFGMGSFVGRIAGIIAPFSAYMAKTVPWVPATVFGVLSIVVGLMTLLLPETLGRPLPQTIEEVETWTRTLSPEEVLRWKETQERQRNIHHVESFVANGDLAMELSTPLKT